jgi:hypothetical protein
MPTREDVNRKPRRVDSANSGNLGTRLCAMPARFHDRTQTHHMREFQSGIMEATPSLAGSAAVAAQIMWLRWRFGPAAGRLPAVTGFRSGQAQVPAAANA